MHINGRPVFHGSPSQLLKKPRQFNYILSNYFIDNSNAGQIQGPAQYLTYNF